MAESHSKSHIPLHIYVLCFLQGEVTKNTYAINLPISVLLREDASWVTVYCLGWGFAYVLTNFEHGEVFRRKTKGSRT